MSGLQDLQSFGPVSDLPLNRMNNLLDMMAFELPTDEDNDSRVSKPDPARSLVFSPWDD